MTDYRIVKNTRDYERESRTSNRTYVGTVTTWDVVDYDRCALVSEHRTKREAVAALARLTTSK